MFDFFKKKEKKLEHVYIVEVREPDSEAIMFIASTRERALQYIQDNVNSNVCSAEEWWWGVYRELVDVDFIDFPEFDNELTYYHKDGTFWQDKYHAPPE